MTRIAPRPTVWTACLLALGGGGDEPVVSDRPSPVHAATSAGVPEQASGHQRMLGILAHIARVADDENRFVGNYELRKQRVALETLAPDAPLQERLLAAFSLVSQLLRVGRVDESITVLQATRKLIQRLPDPAVPAAELSFRLGVAWLRKGELENCVNCCAGESCTYPLSAAGVHAKPEGSRNAIRHFLDVLGYSPPSSSMHVRSRWLLNIAHMTLGTFPEGVPSQYRIDPALIAGSADFPAFENAAPTLGLDLFQLAGGCIVDDFTGDGIYDVLTTTSDPCDSARFFRGTAEGVLADETEEMGLESIVGGGLNVARADYDNDGDIDVLIPRGAWLQEKGRHPSSLLRNDGAAGFRDVTFDAGLLHANYPSQVAVWADYDNDGNLDLFLGSEANADHPYPCCLFRSNGDGTFTDVAAQAGVQNGAFTKGAAWGDYDNDRWPDLYVSNLGGRNRLFRNNADGTFTDVAPGLDVTKPLRSFPCWFWDFDNDGNLDLFVSSYDEDVSAFVAARLSLPTNAEPAALYRGDGKGGFVNVADSHGLALPLVTMGAGFGDLDNDGYLDMYLGTGFPSFEGLVPNLLYHNRGGERFENVTGASRMGNLQKGHAIAFADLDRDGDEDVFARLGGAFRDDGFSSALYRNPGFGNQWVAVRLVGTRSNRAGVGARIHARSTENGAQRDVWRWVGQGSSFGNNPLEQHVGVGQASRLDLLEVYWPTSDTTQVFRDVDVGRRYEITEGADELEVLPCPAIVQPQAAG